MQPDVASALSEAANLLLVGMVVVFLFLSMLIGAITLIAWLNKLFPDPSATAQPSLHSATKLEKQNNQGLSPQIVAAIGAAIHQHRRLK